MRIWGKPLLIRLEILSYSAEVDGARRAQLRDWWS